ncbi:MAG: hypothetical protein AAGD43_03355 [Pseudomonadota bacterium]
MTETIERPGLTIELVPVDALAQVLPVVEHLMRDLPERSGGAWTLPGIQERLVNGVWQLWCVHDQAPQPTVMAIVGTSVWTTMSGIKTCSIHFCTGDNSKDWMHLLAVIEQAARNIGAKRIETVARKGWARKLKDYRTTHLVLEKAL